MKAFRTGHYFLALFFTGFLTGILIVNYIWGEQLSLIGTFTEVYLMRLKNEKISFQQYIWYLIQVRGIFFLVLFLAMVPMAVPMEKKKFFRTLPLLAAFPAKDHTPVMIPLAIFFHKNIQRMKFTKNCGSILTVRM